MAYSASAGSTSGFTYANTTDYNVIAYDTNVTSSVSPTASQSPAGTSVALAALVTASVLGTGSGSISPVGVLASNSGTGLTTLALSPATAGDAMILEVWANSSTATVTSVSGGGSTWTRLEQYQNSFPSDEELWLGTVTSTGTSTVTVGFSTSVASDHVELSAQEFTAGLGASTVWGRDKAGSQSNASSSTVALPSLTPTGSSELYFGYGGVANSASAGSTSGFAYAITADNNVIAYDTNVSSSVSPTASQSPAGTSFALAALVTASMSTVGNPDFYIDDALGSTQWLINLSGSVVGSYAYSTYGSTLSHTGTASTPIGFAGAYTDPETGFLYLVNRYYDPVTGEFVTVDPEVVTTVQPYAYAADDPVDGGDPTGLNPAPSPIFIEVDFPGKIAYIFLSAAIEGSNPGIPGLPKLGFGTDDGFSLTWGGAIASGFSYKNELDGEVSLAGVFAYDGESISVTRDFSEPLRGTPDTVKATVTVSVSSYGSPPTGVPSWAKAALAVGVAGGVIVYVLDALGFIVL